MQRFALMSTEQTLTTAFVEATALSRPLCVDLDGTLITTDSLWESVVLLFRRRPLVALMTPLWLFGGRARFKRAIAEHVVLDPASLPYRRELVQALRVSHERGRTLVLATAADRKIAERVAEHLGLFDAVHATDGAENLKANAKRAVLQASYGAGFDYVGDSSADEPILEAATQGFLVGASARAVQATRRLSQVTVVSRRPSLLRALLKQLRPHQWSKNALVMVPIFLANKTPSLLALSHGLLAFATFSLCASSGYVFNDLLDIEADRVHATKYKRPFASGALPVIWGPPLFFGLITLSFVPAFLCLPLGFSAMLALYFVGTLSYSLYLKRVLMMDVLVLAGLYTHRILSGGVATGVRVSTWLLGFSMFFFTSLAFAKRYVELRPLTSDDKIKNRGYYRTDLQMVSSMGTGSGFIAALVFMLYVDSAAVRMSYREPELLWLVLPVLLYWLGRIWLLAGRGKMQDDPVKFAVKDWHSLACGALIALVAAAARFTPAWVTAVLH